MVTKHKEPNAIVNTCSVLAKILMVTKRYAVSPPRWLGSVLAKILMVTKQKRGRGIGGSGSVLAKILMVTKHI